MRALALMVLIAAGCEESVGSNGKDVGRVCVPNQDQCDDYCVAPAGVTNGTCSTKCINDADCPKTTRCVVLRPDGVGYCAATCAVDSNCWTPLGCVDKNLFAGFETTSTTKVCYFR